VKRIIAALAIGLVSLAPNILSAHRNLESSLDIYSQVNQFGDVTIKWNPTEFVKKKNIKLAIGYYFDQEDRPGELKPKPVDASAGSASFKNLSLNARYLFSVSITQGNRDTFTKRLLVVTPNPNRPITKDSAVNAQLSYVDAHWRTRENPNYLYIPDFDCANFVSQTLVARGFRQNYRWNQIKRVPTHAFISSTALKAYLLTLPGVHEVSSLSPNKVKLGDIAMFDWDRSGDTDHVGIVNYIQRRPDGSLKIYIAQHTMHRYFRSVSWAVQVNHPNANYSFISLPTAPTDFSWPATFDTSGLDRWSVR